MSMLHVWVCLTCIDDSYVNWVDCQSVNIALTHVHMGFCIDYSQTHSDKQNLWESSDKQLDRNTWHHMVLMKANVKNGLNRMLADLYCYIRCFSTWMSTADQLMYCEIWFRNLFQYFQYISWQFSFLNLISCYFCLPHSCLLLICILCLILSAVWFWQCVSV